MVVLTLYLMLELLLRKLGALIHSRKFPFYQVVLYIYKSTSALELNIAALYGLAICYLDIFDKLYLLILHFHVGLIGFGLWFFLRTDPISNVGYATKVITSIFHSI